jgi:hypothetical protein
MQPVETIRALFRPAINHELRKAPKGRRGNDAGNAIAPGSDTPGLSAA